MKPVVIRILAVKALIFLFGLWGYVLFAASSAEPLSGETLLKIWCRWDGNRYIAIAMNGYVSGGEGVENIVLYPVFPLVIRLFTFVFRNPYFSALLASNLASLAALFLFYRLAEREKGPERADSALWALLLFPTAYFFNAAYSEGPFLLACVGSFLAARNGRWALAGLAGGIAALSRMAGLCLFPALIAEFVLQRLEGKAAKWQAVWLLAIPASVLIYLGLNYLVLGDMFAFLYAQKDFWKKEISWPWIGLVKQGPFSGSWPNSAYNLNVGWMEVSAALLFVAGTVYTFFHERLSYTVYVGSLALLCLSTGFLLSTPRYLLTAFPLFFMAPAVEKPGIRHVVAVVLMGGLLALYTSRFVLGQWAF